MGNKKWIAGFFFTIFLWFVIIGTTVGFAVTGKEFLIKDYDISLITLPLLVFVLIFIGLNFFMILCFLIFYSKTVSNQISAKKWAAENFYSKQAFKTQYKDPKVSIIIPGHNEEQVIKNTILNCLTQSYENIEVVAVCHNCTDKTVQRAREVKDERVSILDYRSEKSGKGVALNYGVMKSKGDYILILDADGKLNETFIEDALPMLLKEKFAAVQGRSIPTNRYYNLLTRLLGLEGDLWAMPFLTMRSVIDNRVPLTGTGYIMDKKILKEVGGFGDSLVEDHELSFKLYRNGHRIGFVPLSLYFDEKPPSLDITFTQRARWGKGFLVLMKGKVAEFKDVIGDLVYIQPAVFFLNMILLGIISYSTLHYWGFNYFPYSFSYIPYAAWIGLVVFSLVGNFLVLVKLYGREGLSYAKYIPLLFLFSNFGLPVSIKAFFIKSWAESKTTHGFLKDEQELEKPKEKVMRTPM